VFPLLEVPFLPPFHHLAAVVRLRTRTTP
jgi:hypothetical protein